MQKSIEEASNWYSENCLVLNSAKTDVMTMSNTSNMKAPDSKFDILTFKQSFKIKYLGVILDYQLNFKPHTKKLSEKFIRLLLIIRETANIHKISCSMVCWAHTF